MSEQYYNTGSKSEMDQWKEKYKDLIDRGLMMAKEIESEYEIMSMDLEEYDDSLLLCEKEHYIKKNEKRHADWLYLNIK